jgi:hypothetical protein
MNDAMGRLADALRSLLNTINKVLADEPAPVPVNEPVLCLYVP